MRGVTRRDPTDHSATFPVFAASWALVILWGMSSEIMAGTVLSVLVCVTGAYALIRPNDPKALAGVAGAYVVHWMIDDYRHDFVHTWFDFWGCVLVLIGLASSYHRDLSTWRHQFVMRAGPAAVAFAGVCFFAAGLAKINIDYMRPETSCGAAFYAWQRTYFPYSMILPQGNLGNYLGMFGAVTSEIVAPLLWIHHRTRKIGFFIGFLLMFLLGTNAYARYYVFTGPFIALIILGMDWRVLVNTVERSPLQIQRVYHAMVALVVFGLALAMTVGSGGEGLLNRHFAVRTFFVVYALTILGMAIFAKPIRFGPIWRGNPWHKLAWAVVLFSFCFESLPYFGMRSGRNFTMAANFQLDDGYSNHLIFRRPLPFPFDKAAFGKALDLRVGKSRERAVDCGKRRPGDDKKKRIEKEKRKRPERRK